MPDRLINIGFGNTVNCAKLFGVVAPEAAPVRRLVQNAKELGKCIDATQGRKTKAVIVMEDGVIVLSAVTPDTITKRFSDTGEYQAAADKLSNGSI